MLWIIVVGTAYSGGAANVDRYSYAHRSEDLSNLLPDTLLNLQAPSEEEKEILRLWDETVKELERSSPFGLPIPKGDKTTPNYEQSSCSAQCSAGSCSVSCYGVVICGCTPNGAPVCRCRSSGIVPTGGSKRPHSDYSAEAGDIEVSEDIKVSAVPGGIEISSYSNGDSNEVKIWDVSGRLVTRFTLKDRKVLRLRRGLYFVKVGSRVKKVLVR
ncbi:MAG: T9SS type A sorting domain-containing protein [Thermotogae bacterium]|nr:T9SS type A sorting domain-containing protein [Thermotogota bacterium]